MKKLSLAIAIIFVSAIPVFAQSNSGYRTDNFDFNLVKIETPPPAPVAPGRKSRKRLLTSTNFNYSPSGSPLTQLTSMSLGNSLAGFTTGKQAIDGLIVDSARRHSVDPLLVYAIMHQESTFKPRALSHKGASGLMQLMPATAVRFGVTSIWDPRQNIEGGTRYMRWLLDKFDGNVQLALAGYNAGEGAVIKFGYRIPPYSETQEYVRRITRRYSLIRDPLAAHHANSVSRDQVAQKESAPLSIYERTVFAARLPDGRLQLISQ